ncbi:MAG: hypothetical protein NTW16_18925, partial [Bacteroidetes bacterium]|nr:hypothetical protein [Bacteroidota bacterium]
TAISALTIGSGSTFTTAAAHTITATNITVNGTYTNGSTGALTVTNWVVGSTGIYNHNTSSATLPLGTTTTTWDADSKLNITGAYTAATVFLNFTGQTFGNFTFNPSSMNSTVALIGAAGTANIQGDFTITHTGTGTLYMRITGQQFAGTINIDKNFTLTAGTFDLHNGGATPTSEIINLKGNFTISGTSVLTQTTTQTGSLVGFNFTGSGTQTISVSPSATISSQATTPTCAIMFTVATGSTIDMGTSVLTGTNNTSFTLSPGANIITANTGGLSASGATGSIQVSGARSFSTTANYTYNGTSPQVTGNGLPSSVNDLTISNAAGLTFSAAETINGTMAISSGAKANLGTFTSYATILTLGGSTQSSPASYGGTGAGGTGTIINTTYFDAASGWLAVGTIPPSGLSYTTPNLFPANVAITPLNPTVTGIPTSYTVLPALPTGLSIHPATGVISGTPTVSTASATYTVTASNGGGSTTFGVVIAVGNNFYAIASTNWNVASTWSLASGGTAGTTVPGAGDNVFISETGITRTVTIPSGINALCGSLTIGRITTGTPSAAGILTFTDATSTLIVGGNTIINKPNATATNLINLNAGAMTVNGNVELSRVQTASTSTSRISRINISTGTLTIAGNLTFSATAAAQSQIVFSGAGTLNIGGNFTLTNSLGTLTPSTGTVNFNGAAQTVPDISAIAYNHLTLSGSGIKTLPVAMTSISGNMTLNGTATATTAANLAIAGTLTVGSGTTFETGTNFTIGVTGATSVTGTLTLAGTGTKTFTGNVTVYSAGSWNETGIAAINFVGNLQNDGASFTALSGAHTFSGATKTISGSSEISIPNVAFTGTYTNSGTLTVSTALSGAGGLTNGNGTVGTLNLGGTSGITSFNATPAGNTVNYTGTGQTLRVTAYHHLKLSGGAETFGAITTVAGNLTLSGAATATTGAGLAVSGNLGIGDGTTLTAAGYNLTITGTTTVGDGTSGNLTISSATGTKLFTGLVTIASGATWNNSENSALEFRGGITTTPSFNGGSGVHTFTTNTQALTGIFTIPGVTVTTITLTNNNSLTVVTALEGTGGLTQATSANLLIGGTAGISTLTATATGNLVNYYGGAQTVHANTYYDLTLSGTGTKTTTGVTVNNLLSMEGTTAAASALPAYGASAILQYKGETDQVTGAEFPASITSGQLAGIKIENTLGVTLNSAKDIGARYLTIGSTIANSVFNDGGYQLTATGTLNLTSGIFKLGAATATTFPAFTTNNIDAGTTVDYAA